MPAYSYYALSILRSLAFLFLAPIQRTLPCPLPLQVRARIPAALVAGDSIRSVSVRRESLVQGHVRLLGRRLLVGPTAAKPDLGRTGAHAEIVRVSIISAPIAWHSHFRPEEPSLQIWGSQSGLPLQNRKNWAKGG